ncbi:MAG: HAMP domain-containing sensor histidine kinase [bacterium]
MMFKDLKRKFVILNMIIISFILLISFSFIYIINYATTHREINSKVDINPNFNILSNNRPAINNVHSNQDISSFSIILNSSSDIIEIFSYFDYEDEFYDNLVENIDIDKKKKEFVKFESSTWFYSITNFNKFPENLDGGELIISFVNVDDEMNSLKYLLIALIITFFIMVFIVYYISLYFSNKYIEPIEKNYNKQKRFIADASHELKTPIAIISANADALLISENDSKKERDKWIKYIKEETKSMNKLVADLLMLAKSEEINLNISEVNLSELLENTIISLDAVAYENNLVIKRNIQKDIVVKSDAYRLKQIFKIFLDNAIKYSKDKTSIKVNLEKNKKDIILTFSNKADLKDEDIDKIFDRFYKCDEARTNNKSFGLGLSIANNILSDLNYTVKVHKDKGYINFVIKIK